MARSPAPLTLKGKALQLLSARDYTRAEMQRKLALWVRQQAQRAATAANLQSQHPALSVQASAMSDCEETLVQQQHADIQTVLNHMEDLGFLSDARAAESLVHRRSSRLGNRRLQQELRQKGLDADTIADAMHHAGSELERAQHTWQRKFGTLPQTPQERLKHMRFLAQRGFGADTVRRVLQQRDEDGLWE